MSDLQIERLELPIQTARKVGYLLGIIFLLIVLWASICPVNVISKGKGQLRPYGKPKLVQAQVSGQVEDILVREGSHVEKGDVLVELDASIYRSKLDKTEIELKKSKTKLVELTDGIEAIEQILKNPNQLPVSSNEIGKVAIVIDKVYTTYRSLQESKYDATTGASGGTELSSEMTELANMKSQYEQEKAQKRREIALLKQQLITGTSQKKTAIKGIESKIASHKEMLGEVKNVLALSKEQERDYAEVIDLGVSRVQYLKVKQQVAQNSKNVKNEEATIKDLENKLQMAKLELTRWTAETKSRIIELGASEKGLNANIDGVNIKMRKSQKEFKNEEAAYNAARQRAKATLTSQQNQLNLQQKRVKEAIDSIEIAKAELNKAIIKAPMSGIVTGFKVRGAGEIVKPSEKLMEILPDKSDLVIEAKIENKDIGFVKEKQPVKIKLDAFPFQDFGVINGVVEEVERYPEKLEKKGYAYTVWIKPNQDYIKARGKEVKLRSGLTATVEIVVRQVTVLRALLNPIAKFTDISIKE